MINIETTKLVFCMQCELHHVFYFCIFLESVENLLISVWLLKTSAFYLSVFKKGQHILICSYIVIIEHVYERLFLFLKVFQMIQCVGNDALQRFAGPLMLCFCCHGNKIFKQVYLLCFAFYRFPIILSWFWTSILIL